MENVTEQLFEEESILDKAKDIRAGSRQSDYGDAVTNFKRIATIASIASDKEITAVDAVNVLIAVKIVREAFHHKEDNLVDLCGYADIKNLIMEEEQ